MKKKKLVIYGAFDRYNYGDNLMPIVFEDYLRKYESYILDEFDVIYSSICDSDLSRYDCLKTVAIRESFSQLRNGDAILVAGGEVLCSKNSTLFLHMPRSKWKNDILTRINRLPVLRDILNLYARYALACPWSYPYIPDQSKLADGVKVIYNTVGGSIMGLRKYKLSFNDIKSRLEKSDYLSVRDKRTVNNIDGIDSNLAPDSVHIISELYDEKFLQKKVRPEVKSMTEGDYICFQAAPNKIGENIVDVSNNLRLISANNNCRILLLPIGYASGHDDEYYLRELHSHISDISEIATDLTVWEIMYVIKESTAYLGTSLHGAITALSFSKPHFGLNRKIIKLNDFLLDWSVPPFNRNYATDEIAKLGQPIKNIDLSGLQERVQINNSLIKENFTNIVNCLNFSKGKNDD
ncbi:polysaccharide pyruvyl transferase family protein [Vibrio breoganii]